MADSHNEYPKSSGESSQFPAQLLKKDRAENTGDKFRALSRLRQILAGNNNINIRNDPTGIKSEISDSTAAAEIRNIRINSKSLLEVNTRMTLQDRLKLHGGLFVERVNRLRNTVKVMNTNSVGALRMLAGRGRQAYG